MANSISPTGDLTHSLSLPFVFFPLNVSPICYLTHWLYLSFLSSKLTISPTRYLYHWLYLLFAISHNCSWILKNWWFSTELFQIFAGGFTGGDCYGKGVWCALRISREFWKTCLVELELFDIFVAHWGPWIDNPKILSTILNWLN